MRKITEIIVHCTATREGREVTVREIDSWHKQRGWAGIGYHYVVCLDGKICVGREESRVGAHCKDHNRNSIGVVYVGGLASDAKTPKDTRTEAQKKSLRSLLKLLKKRYPNATIHGHREYAAKACPCFDAKKEYADL